MNFFENLSKSFFYIIDDTGKSKKINSMICFWKKFITMNFFENLSKSFFYIIDDTGKSKKINSMICFWKKL